MPLPGSSHVEVHTIKRSVSVCPHYFASISRCRLSSRNSELCFSRLLVIDDNIKFTKCIIEDILLFSIFWKKFACNEHLKDSVKFYKDSNNSKIEPYLDFLLTSFDFFKKRIQESKLFFQLQFGP